MKLLIITLLSVFALNFVIGSVATAATDEKTNEKEKAAPKKSAKQTEANFEDLLVQGKYHFSDEAVVTVEQDKILDALLGVRTDFKDRIEQSTTRF